MTFLNHTRNAIHFIRNFIASPIVSSIFTRHPKRETVSKSTGHPVGPITSQNKHQFMTGQNYDIEKIMNHYTPSMGLSVFDGVDKKILNPIQLAAKHKANHTFMPTLYTNPLQDLDYIFIESFSRFTFVGSLLDAFTKFVVGTGFRPELELINPTGNQKQDEEEIKKNQDMIQMLNQIDNQINQNSGTDVSFHDKIFALISATNIYNRAALQFVYDTPIKVNGVTYPNIPSSLKFIHPRDLGLIEVNPDNNALSSVQIRYEYSMIPTKDMIYLWNPAVSAKTRNSWYYGDSLIMPMIDAARTIRQLLAKDFPAMASATWAGMFLMTVRPDGATIEQKQAEQQNIANNMVTGGPNILMQDPDDVKVDTVDYNPKITEFQQLMESLIKYCVASLGLPHSMFFDESASNRATMIGKIQLATSTVINPMRAMFGRLISDQWYDRWFKEICIKTNRTELLDKFRIKMVFNDIQIEEWFDKIEAVNLLDSRRQLTDAAYGDKAGLDNYTNMVDVTSETIPGGSGAGVKFRDSEGKGFEFKETK